MNKNNNSNAVNDIFSNNNVSESLTNRYISDKTHHNGYHDLYNRAVKKAVNNIQKEMVTYRNDLLKQGYSNDEINKMVKRESRKQTHSLVEDLRVMNQDGIDLYYDHDSNSKKYTNQKDYNMEFEQKMKEAHKKNMSKCKSR